MRMATTKSQANPGTRCSYGVATTGTTLHDAGNAVSGSILRLRGFGGGPGLRAAR
jgi:hypothetical protein